VVKADVLLRGELLCEELICKELFRLSARTTPKSKASTSAARKTAPRRPILRDNLPRVTRARVI